jgi:hypothetical protein
MRTQIYIDSIPSISHNPSASWYPHTAHEGLRLHCGPYRKRCMKFTSRSKKIITCDQSIVGSGKTKNKI